MNKLRLIFAGGLIVSMSGLAIISIVEHQYKTFALGVLYSIANVIIFIL